MEECWGLESLLGGWMNGRTERNTCEFNCLYYLICIKSIQSFYLSLAQKYSRVHLIDSELFLRSNIHFPHQSSLSLSPITI